MPSVKLGKKRLLLSPADLVVPLCCGIFLHLFFVLSLGLTRFIFYDSTDCNNTLIFFIYIYCAIGCHSFIIVLNTIGMTVSFRTKVLHYSPWLPRILHIRSVLNWIDVAIASWGLYLIFFKDFHCLQDSNPVFILLVFLVMTNWLILILGCCTATCLSWTDKKYNDAQMQQSGHGHDYNPGLYGARRSSDHPQRHELTTVTNEFSNKMRRCFCGCFWEDRAWNQGDVTAQFTQMGQIMTILSHTESYNDDNLNNLVASDIFCGLQLYRMLQKHYLLHDLGFYRPYKSNNYRHSFMPAITNENTAGTSTNTPMTPAKNDISMQIINHNIKTPQQGKDNALHTSQNAASPSGSAASSASTSPLLSYGTFNAKDEHEPPFMHRTNSKNAEGVESYLYRGIQPKLSNVEVNRIEEGVYYSKYAIAAYGLPLYLLEYPCGMCCATPCCLPKGLLRSQIMGSACCGLSSIKVFLRRSGIDGDDLLLADQRSGLHQTTYFIAIDHSKKQLVIAVRGSESIPDAVTDANCKPTECPSIDTELYSHEGIMSAMLNLFKCIEEHDETQAFLANNKDYGIVLCGHSLGAGVSVLLTLQLLKNKNGNKNYENRDIYCYAIAPPPLIDCTYAKQVMSWAERYITCFIYSKDMVPRLQWASVIKTKSAIIRLLKECDQSSWWIYRKGFETNEQTIINAISPQSEYIIADDGVDKEQQDDDIVIVTNDGSIVLDVTDDGHQSDGYDELKDDNDNKIDDEWVSINANDKHLKQLRSAHNRFLSDIKGDIKAMSEMAARDNIFGDHTIWNTKFQHIGMVFHIINNNDCGLKLKKRKAKQICKFCGFLCNVIGNCLRCQACIPDKNEYLIYRADPDGFNDLVVSSRMMSDHMPHVYKNALQSLDVDYLRLNSNFSERVVRTQCSRSYSSYLEQIK